jgi:hypothetical protein
MPRFLIERTIPSAGRLSAADRQTIARKSCDVLRQMGPDIQWVQSYTTDDHFYCVYIAPDAEMVRDHARRGGFPADRVLEVHAIVDPTTADATVATG